MSGLPGHNYEAFHDASAQLRALGHHVQNPAENGGPDEHPGWDWLDWMRLAITQLMLCDAVALLPGWRDSRGAEAEAALAGRLDYDVREIHFWLGGEDE